MERMGCIDRLAMSKSVAVDKMFFPNVCTCVVVRSIISRRSSPFPRTFGSIDNIVVH